MQIEINGEMHKLSGQVSVSDIIEKLDLANKRIAIEINEELVPRSTFDRHLLHDGDKIEIVHAIGGG
jgi:thiamine biosynthesis protein ThiS